MALLTTDQQARWKEGKLHDAYKYLGAHAAKKNNKKGVRFSVWAPHAHRVSVVGDFNNWNGDINVMEKDHETGIWSTFVPDVDQWAIYKYEVKTGEHAPPFLKIDPYAFVSELRPKVASLVYNIDQYDWNDQGWIDQRPGHQGADRPLSIYEVHLGSWRRKGEYDEYLNYRELADELVTYVNDMGFTHIEIMPVAEHPYDPSWGYQIMNYFAPTSRYGNPADFMYFVDQCHQNDIGIILDWVPAHFPRDEQGLQMYDGAALYEHSDPQRREQKDWGTHVFDYGKAGVRNFLLSNALFWCEKYHIDGLRVDAVASMLYLNYSKQEGEWSPNQYGGHEHLEAIEFLKQFNALMQERFPGVMTFAEESTSWSGVTQPTEYGGLGFDFKWNMGWMNDTLEYMEMEVEDRYHNSNNITFPMLYAMSEKFVLPLSHDEVVHMKKPLIYKSPGFHPEQFANLRLLYLYQIAHPGKKLLFMGGEFGQTSEWAEDTQLDWYLLNYDDHRGIKQLYKDLLSLYQTEESLYEQDNSYEGFEWTDLGNTHGGVFSFLRKAEDPANHLFFILNFSNQMIGEYHSGPFQGVHYEVILNSDSYFYGGSNRGGTIDRFKKTIPVAPFSGLVLKPKGR